LETAAGFGWIERDAVALEELLQPEDFFPLRRPTDY
jgi:hypothetical protein